MPKSNRKGYFVMKLRDQGLDQEIERSNLVPKGIKKQPKISAKQARQRKKIYIAHLQEKIKQMTDYSQRLKNQNNQLKNQCQRLKIYIAQSLEGQKLLTKYEDITDQSHNHKIRFQGLFKQIRSLTINLQNKNSQEISRNLSILRDKYGISGRERLKYIDEQFDRIINILMPLHYRLLMQNCQNNKQFYTLFTSQFKSPNILRNQDRQRQILINVRPQIIRQRQQFDKILVSLAQIRYKIRNQNYKCQAIVDQMQDKLDPIFIGRLLLDLDFSRSQQNLDIIYPVNFWTKLKEQGYQMRITNKNPPQNEMKQISFRFEDDMEIINSLFS